jgi:predicted nucleic acid-binding protein
VARLVPAKRTPEAEALERLEASGAVQRGVGKPGRREGALTPAQLRRIVRALDEEWLAYDVVEVSDALVRRAGALAERHALRAFDALQPAAALELRREGVSPVFAGFDAKLLRAARRERLSSAL